jgi:hypothetical protein
MATADSHRRGDHGDAADHRRQMAKLVERLPGPVGRAVAWLLRPESRWLRIPLGGGLILGSLFSFLPILGLWMLPLGALLLAEDFPFIRRPTTRAIDVVERWWADRRNKRPRRRAQGREGHAGARNN